MFQTNLKKLSKNDLSETGGITSGGLAGIGSLYPMCHSICMSIVSLLSVIGITISILPLMFLQTYQPYFWLAALFFTALSLRYYLQKNPRVARDKNLLLINSGLLVFGLPVVQLAEYMDFFRFIGVSLVLSGLLFFIFRKKIPVTALSGNAGTIDVSVPRFNMYKVVTILLLGIFLMNQYLIWQMTKASGKVASSLSLMGASLSTMKFTPFDVVLAKERMDKNNDGICDTCGMPLQQCIDAGQMDCSMGNTNPQAIGVLGSQHIHADLNIYINGQRLAVAKPENYMKSSIIHLDNSQNPDDANSVVHMHATKVPLSLFFRSLGMNLTKDSLTLADGTVLKNENGSTLKFYLDGKKVDELGDYVFQPLDKLLISYGPENDSNLPQELLAMTNFAKDHK